ncbi:Ecd family [Trinorchestia longiramus]|nr:Ecd family [Trinorchestia longiramus]
MASYNDVIQYWLFPLGSDGSVVTSETELKSYSQVYLTALLPHMETYIWNQDHFNLRVVKENVTHGLEGAVPNHLYGESCVGDYIEDEWYITYLLRELSSIFPQLVIRVCDSDGEFLLVEAADHLPAWADPETAEQRVSTLLSVVLGVGELTPYKNKEMLVEVLSGDTLASSDLRPLPVRGPVSSSELPKVKDDAPAQAFRVVLECCA